jgi:hypothetical protein
MKYLIALTLSLGISSVNLAWAEDATTPSATDTSELDAGDDPAQALQDLCKSYVKDGTIAETELNQCLSGMTALSNPVPEPLPFMDEENEATATPSAEQANDPDPEALVKDEIVDKPDPQAEQLSVQ